MIGLKIPCSGIAVKTCSAQGHIFSSGTALLLQGQAGAASASVQIR